MDEVWRCEMCDWPYESEQAALYCAQYDELESD